MTVKVLGHHNSLASANIFKLDERCVDLSVAVRDGAIREVGLPNHGSERVFALVPHRNGHWSRVDLKFQGSHTMRAGPMADVFTGRLDIQQDVNVDDLRSKGVAFGIEIQSVAGREPSIIWLQGYEDNYKLPR